jgi:hypothetical protein
MGRERPIARTRRDVVIEGAALVFACKPIGTGGVVSRSRPILPRSDQLQQQQHGQYKASEEQVQGNSRQAAEHGQRHALFALRSECASVWALVRLSSMETDH